MKNLVRTTLAFMAFLFAINLIAAEKKDFEAVLTSLDKAIPNYHTDKFYEKHEFKNKKTGEVKKFSNFGELERAVFIFFQGDKLSHDLEGLYEKWQAELKSAEDKPEDEEDASKKDVEKYLEKLMVLRKKNAEKVESLIADLFKKWPDKFTDKEKDFILKNIKDYHNKNNLIKRDK
jgi:hypothetical protein